MHLLRDRGRVRPHGRKRRTEGGPSTLTDVNRASGSAPAQVRTVLRQTANSRTSLDVSWSEPANTGRRDITELQRWSTAAREAPAISQRRWNPEALRIRQARPPQSRRNGCRRNNNELSDLPAGTSLRGSCAGRMSDEGHEPEWSPVGYRETPTRANRRAGDSADEEHRCATRVGNTLPRNYEREVNCRTTASGQARSAGLSWPTMADGDKPRTYKVN